MTIRNRELSQFGSFVYIEDSTKNISISTTREVPYIGIGTDNPLRKLHIVGDIQIDGNLFYQGQLEFGNVDLNTTGIITAGGFFDPNGNRLSQFDSWSLSDSGIYREFGNVSIGKSLANEKLEVSGNIIADNISASQFISTITLGSPLIINSTDEVTNLNASLLRGGIPGANINSFDIVTIGAEQTINNKTLINPAISGVINFGSATLTGPSTGSYSLTLPSESGTLLTSSSGGVITGLVTTGNILNETILNDDINNSAAISYSKLNLSNSIRNVDIATNAAIDVSKLASRTISGVNLGSNLNSLSFGSFISASGSYNGSTPITVSVAATTANTGNTIVSRNSSGDFSAGTISVTNLTATQTVSATTFIGNGSQLTGISAVGGGSSLSDETASSETFYPLFTPLSVGILTTSSVSTTKLTYIPSTGTLTASNISATSDIDLKENIRTITNATETIQSLRGVSFDWKDSGKSSYGVIAQELEKILPELVNQGETKSVNYNGLIGVLIEAVKELSAEVDELRKRIS